VRHVGIFFERQLVTEVHFRSSGFEDGLIDVQLADVSTQALVYKMKGIFGTFTMADRGTGYYYDRPDRNNLGAAYDTTAIAAGVASVSVCREHRADDEERKPLSHHFGRNLRLRDSSKVQVVLA